VKSKADKMKNVTIANTLKKNFFDRADVIALLSADSPHDVGLIREAAKEIMLRECGTAVHCRGLVEFSNQCVNDCHYCGIRKGNSSVKRYSLSKEEILEAARFCADAGYGSMVLQSGERRDEPFIAFVENVVGEIKTQTVSDRLPRGLGVTLCVGEQTEATYRRFFDAGAHRYLLRIETTSWDLSRLIHPGSQQLSSRLECLERLRRIGFQVGTGVMIGLPGQTLEELADDVLFFRDMDIDMIGMGPYIPHRQTPLASVPQTFTKARAFHLGLRMISVCRIVCRDVNIASTTALQALEPDGREQGLEAGANVIMPQVTPPSVRKDYLLYEGKPCLDETAGQCRGCIEKRILSMGRTLGADQWGDPRHFAKRAIKAPANDPFFLPSSCNIGGMMLNSPTIENDESDKA
jgi:biotin synthase